MDVSHLVVGDIPWGFDLNFCAQKPPVEIEQLEAASASGDLTADEELTQWFLSHGADPNAGCGLDFTPLSVAVEKAPFKIIKLLFHYGGSINCGQLLHYAIRRDAPDRLEVLEFILNKGPPINHV